MASKTIKEEIPL